jgi:Phage integrase family
VNHTSLDGDQASPRTRCHWRDAWRFLPQAGIAPCSPNDLRRTYAKWMRLARVPAEIVAPTMGHRDTRMVERVYGRLSPEEIGALLTAHFAPDCIAGASKNIAQGRNRTTDTGIFSPLLYQLSYLGVRRPRTTRPKDGRREGAQE